MGRWVRGFWTGTWPLAGVLIAAPALADDPPPAPAPAQTAAPAQARPAQGQAPQGQPTQGQAPQGQPAQDPPSQGQPAQEPPAPPPPMQDVAPPASPVQKKAPPAPPAIPYWQAERDIGLRAIAARSYREAAHHLALAILAGREVGHVVGEPMERMQQALVHARTQIAAIRIRTGEKDAKVLVDGVDMGFAPIVGEVLADPGEHRVVVQTDKCWGEHRFTVKAGQIENVSVRCYTHPRWRIPLLTIGSVASAAGLVSTIIGFVVANDKQNAVGQIAQEARQYGVAPTYLREWAHRTETERVYFMNVGMTSLLLTGAVLGGTIALGVKVPARARPAGMSIGFSAGPNGGALWGTW